MATLAAYDPGHGAHPWSWMKTRLFSCLQRALRRRYSSRVWARALAWVQGRSTIMTGQIPEGSGETSQLYPCIGSSTQESHGEARGKQTKINCTLPKTSVPEQTGLTRLVQAMLGAVDRCQLSQGRKRARPDRAGEPVTGMGDKLTDSRVRQARCASTDQPLFAIRTAVSQ